MKLKKSVAISETGFVFNPGRGESFTTNPIGLDILQLLKEGKSEPEILEHLADLYQVDQATCEKDLYDFLSILKKYNLLEDAEN